MQIRAEDPGAPDVSGLLAEHLADMHALSPAESVHALDVELLRAPGIAFVAARDQRGVLLAVGALAELDARHGELKSMRTAAAARGRGVGAAVLAHLVAEARLRGYRRVSLETGTHAYFDSAHRLYTRAGFAPCPPFGDSVEDPHSRFFTLALAPSLSP